MYKYQVRVNKQNNESNLKWAGCQGYDFSGNSAHEVSGYFSASGPWPNTQMIQFPVAAFTYMV